VEWHSEFAASMESGAFCQRRGYCLSLSLSLCVCVWGGTRRSVAHAQPKTFQDPSFHELGANRIFVFA
jgi:hypothetical protein